MSDSNLEITPPSHPGEFLKKWLMERRGLSVSEVASAADLPDSTIQNIVDERMPIDEEIAIKLSKVFGGTAETLYRMQAAYDFFNQQRRLPDYEKLPTLDL